MLNVNASTNCIVASSPLWFVSMPNTYCQLCRSAVNFGSWKTWAQRQTWICFRASSRNDGGNNKDCWGQSRHSRYFISRSRSHYRRTHAHNAHLMRRLRALNSSHFILYAFSLDCVWRVWISSAFACKQMEWKKTEDENVEHKHSMANIVCVCVRMPNALLIFMREANTSGIIASGKINESIFALIPRRRALEQGQRTIIQFSSKQEKKKAKPEWRRKISGGILRRVNEQL